MQINVETYLDYLGFQKMFVYCCFLAKKRTVIVNDCKLETIDFHMSILIKALFELNMNRN